MLLILLSLRKNLIEQQEFVVEEKIDKDPEMSTYVSRHVENVAKKAYSPIAKASLFSKLLLKL